MLYNIRNEKTLASERCMGLCTYITVQTVPRYSNLYLIIESVCRNIMWTFAAPPLRPAAIYNDD